MSRTLVAVALSLSAIACTPSPSPSPPPRSELDARRAELGRVTVAFTAPEGCQQLGNVFAQDHNVFVERATEAARMRMQLRALELGANYVQAPPAQLIYGAYGPTGAMMQGVAYRCPAQPATPPTAATTTPPPAVAEAVPAPVVTTAR